MSKPLIAILRGITPEESTAVLEVLIEQGFDWIEVPLNSPDALQSIERMRQHAAETIHIGAGTVVTVEDVQRVCSAGGDFIVSPNCDTAVIRQTKALDMGSYPGVLTPTECFAAIHAGADALKLFPASMLGTSGVKAIRAVLPADMPVYAVGGVGPDNMAEWIASGVDGFGIGSALYQPGKSLADIAASARQFMTAWDSTQS